ncbi:MULTISPECIES: hypothetical protein [unclassified Streptomyces]|uniref:hypothetical protein n=1 Tax=unclassified Streptomyces TaxID=2593676 RepID=UPI002E2E1A29|nr:hypothetical protein [Streptomyces sp. NBC_00228]
MSALTRVEEIVRNTDTAFLDEHWERNADPHQIASELYADVRVEVLAEDGQAYDGELAMLRGLVRVLRAVVRENDTLDEVRRLLWQHLADDGDARGEKGSREADATPTTARCSVCRHTFEDCTCGGDSR